MTDPIPDFQWRDAGASELFMMTPPIPDAAVKALGREYAALVAEQVWPPEAAGRKLAEVAAQALATIDRSDELDAEVARLKSANQSGTAALGFLAALLVERDARIERLSQLLADGINQIEYLHEKFAETGSGNGYIAQARSALEQTHDR